MVLKVVRNMRLTLLGVQSILGRVGLGSPVSAVSTHQGHVGLRTATPWGNSQSKLKVREFSATHAIMSNNGTDFTMASSPLL